MKAKLPTSKVTIDTHLDGYAIIGGKKIPVHAFRKGCFVVHVDKLDHPGMRDLFEMLMPKKDWRRIPFAMTLEPWHPPKSYDQVKTIWGMLRVLSWVCYQEFGHEQTLYGDMLDAAAPGELSPISNRRRPTKTLSGMNTVEAAQCIEWLMDKLLERGEMITQPQDLGKWWREWSRWRFAGNEDDPLAKTYKDLDDYRHRVKWCEACMTYLDPEQEDYGGELAHIVSRGAGGPLDVRNMLHLCAKCHRNIQHEKGWVELCELYPHLWPRVQKARALFGEDALIEPGKEEPRKLLEGNIEKEE